MLKLKPCYKFFENSPAKQLRHIISELFEVIWCFIKWRLTGKGVHRYWMMVETIDLQTACLTLLHIVSTPDEIKDASGYVIAKNECRGYFDE